MAQKELPITLEEQIDMMKKYVSFRQRIRMRRFLLHAGYFRASRYGKFLLSNVENVGINVNIKMYIFDHLRMYKFAHSSSCIIYSLKRYDFPVMFMTCA